MMDNIETLKKDIVEIKQRNARVEAEKAWETSLFRIGTIVVLTYVVATIVLLVIGNEHPFRNAIVPTLGFILSVQSLPFVKREWVRRHSS